MVHKPNIIVIAGPNGAGKSTLAPFLLPELFGVTDYVNADTIAQGLSAFNPEGAALEAGRIMLGRLRELAAQRKDFAFETTLASRWYAGWIKELIENGYEFHLLFIRLASPEIALERVAERVRSGGHQVPELTVRRRFRKGIDNFFSLYQPLADKWSVYDNSFAATPQLIASGEKVGIELVEDDKEWQHFKEKS